MVAYELYCLDPAWGIPDNRGSARNKKEPRKNNSVNVKRRMGGG
jgi:hypothetical protein